MTADEFTAFLTGLPARGGRPCHVDVLGADDVGAVRQGRRIAARRPRLAQILTTKSPTQPERLRHPNIDAVWAGIAATIGTRSRRTDAQRRRADDLCGAGQPD